MSHELRTPLNAIIGYSEMLMEDAEDSGREDTVPDLRRIRAAGNHLLTLIHGVLDLSKIEAGKAEVFAEDFEVTSLIEDVRAVIEPLMANNSNRFVVEHDASLGTMRSDTTKIRQNLFNLLSNAAKFTENGEVRLRVTGVAYGGAEALRFVVSDSGIGIEPDKIETLFDEFTQADASTTKRYGGAGLGLVLTRKFAEMLGGEVSATSALNEGATFTMILPRRIEPAAQPESPRAITEAESEYRGTVLVIDDDEEHHETMAHALPKNGYRLLHARGGEEGLELARSHRPDLITLDIIMDGQDGWSVLSELKKDPAMNGIPVIILTISRNRELAYSLGAADFVTKPFDAGALAQLIGRRSDGDGSSQILVVDDDPAARDMLRRWFVHPGGRARGGVRCVRTEADRFPAADREDGILVGRERQMNTGSIVWPDLRFLVVEDDADMRLNIVRLLEHLGSTRVDQAKEGEDALPYLMDRIIAPDCVIADVAMEPMNGIELAHTIRSDPRIVRHDVPIVLVTGHADSSNIEVAIKLDIDAFVAKPASRTALTSRIEWALTGGKSVKDRMHYARIKLPRKEAPDPAAAGPRKRRTAQVVIKAPRNEDS